ncbi:hypothetical protein ES703_60664 [subsurface metagenome]
MKKKLRIIAVRGNLQLTLVTPRRKIESGTGFFPLIK